MKSSNSEQPNPDEACFTCGAYSGPDAKKIKFENLITGEKITIRTCQACKDMTKHRWQQTAERSRHDYLGQN